MDEEDIKEIIDDFIIEATELIEKMDQDLVSLESDPHNKDCLKGVFRHLHTIKGTANFLNEKPNFAKMGQITHIAEDVLAALLEEKFYVTSEIMDSILQVVDIIKALFASEKQNEISPINIDGVCKILQHILTINTPASKIDTTQSLTDLDLEIEKRLKSLSTKEEKPRNLDLEIEQRLKSLSTKEEKPKDLDLEIEQHLKPLSAKNTPTTKIKAETKFTKQNSQRIPNALLQPLIDLEAADTRRNTGAIELSIRVDRKKLDDLVNLVGELVIGRNQLLENIKHFEDIIEDEFRHKKTNRELGDNTKWERLQQSRQQLSASGDFLNFVTSELQMAVLKTRMQPISKVFNRFNRTVRDLAKELKKKVKLIVDGAETELDKSVIEEIADPLVHLLRNAIDHGLETVPERLAKGKKEQGVIRLSAYHEGNQIIIAISDDGKGIDAKKVKEKALKMGIVNKNDLEHVPLENLINLIFMPGFSTAKEVTAISGRGIGMDVVKNNIEKLNGSIEVSSVIDKGSTFTIRLPLTLAIVQALKINVASEIFAIPLANVVETIRTYTHKVESISGHEVIRFRKNIIPLVRLSRLFSIETIDRCDKVYVVIIQIAEQKIGLVVDKILGQEEIVVKSLGNILDNTPGISGACLAGNGKVILILDMASLVRLLPKKINLGAVKHEVYKQDETSRKQRFSILVVEDSKSERKRICKTLTNNGFKVIEAQDGREALGQLENYNIDLVLTDLEMPDIDGYEFTRKIKKNKIYKDIPVLVISSHRELVDRIKGMEVGIDGYFSKPFDDKQLLKSINKIVSRKQV